MVGKTIVAIFHALGLLLQPEKQRIKLKLKILFKDLQVLFFWVTLYLFGRFIIGSMLLRALPRLLLDVARLGLLVGYWF